MGSGLAEEIPFFSGQQSGLDELEGAAPLFANVRRSGKSIISRPGIAAWEDFPAAPPSTDPVVAMAVIGENRDKLLYVTDDGNGTRKVFVWTTTDTVVNLSAGGTTYQLAGTEAPSIVVGRTYAVITGGGAPQKVTAGLACVRLGGSPPLAIDAVSITQRIILVANDALGLFFWSDLGEGGIETWDQTVEYREAEARPDKLVAIKDTAREAWLFGAQTTQIFAPDPEEVFTPGPVLLVGNLARRSVIEREGMMAWLDDRRRFLLTEGRSVTRDNVISAGIEKTLESLGTVSDCWGYREKIGNHDSLIWTFPTEGRSFAFDTLTATWSENRGFVRGLWSPWRPRSYCWWPEMSLHLVGMPDGTIARLSTDAHTDLDDTIRCVTRTGVISRPTRSTPNTLRLVMKRGQAASSSAAVNVRWKDDGGPWGPQIACGLGTAGDANPVVEINPPGCPYDSRQYEASWSADEAVLLAKATEFYEPEEI